MSSSLSVRRSLRPRKQIKYSVSQCSSARLRAGPGTMCLVSPIQELAKDGGTKQSQIRTQEYPVVQAVAVDRKAERGGHLAHKQPSRYSCGRPGLPLGEYLPADGCKEHRGGSPPHPFDLAHLLTVHPPEDTGVREDAYALRRINRRYASRCRKAPRASPRRSCTSERLKCASAIVGSCRIACP